MGDGLRPDGSPFKIGTGSGPAPFTVEQLDRVLTATSDLGHYEGGRVFVQLDVAELADSIGLRMSTVIERAGAHFLQKG